MLRARTSGVYLRADPGDLAILDEGDAHARAELIAEPIAERVRAAGDRQRLNRLSAGAPR